MKITIGVRESDKGGNGNITFHKATRYSWPVDGTRFSVNLPNKKKFTTTSANIIYMIKEEDDE